MCEGGLHKGSGFPSCLFAFLSILIEYKCIKLPPIPTSTFYGTECDRCKIVDEDLIDPGRLVGSFANVGTPL